MKTEIYLIRHAQPLTNFKTMKFDIDDEQFFNKQIPLSDIGEKQASILAENDNLQNIDVVFSSSYVRAVSTAKHIVNKNKCKFLISDLFNERKLGRNFKREDWSKQLLDRNFKLIDGESRDEVKTRMMNGIYNILYKYSGKRVVVVSHAAAITFLLMNWCDLEEFSLDNKKRKLVFKNKVVINDSFHTPDVFKIVFEEKEPIIIERIK